MTTAHRSPARGMQALGTIVAAYARVSGTSARLRKPTRPVDRSLVAQVDSVEHPCPDVALLRLRSAGPLPAWQPGAHIDVEVPGIGLRQYSLCGDPGADTWTIAVRRVDDGDGGSRAMHALAVGDELTLRGPRHAFPFVTSDAYLFVAGGIGVTPIRPMVRAAQRRGSDWRLVLTGRTRASMPFVDELVALAPERVTVWADDERGVPDGARIVALAPPGAALYVCGPPPMVDAIRTALPAPGIRSLHAERFSAAPVVGGAPFEIALERSGRSVEVAADETALTALRRALPDLAYSCRQGFCGTCSVPLLDGLAEHRDRCLSDAQRVSRFAPCVSRASGRITLDL